ncbi:MAG: transglycosylase domain-containing protein [Patescibacteria group bacterium]
MTKKKKTLLKIAGLFFLVAFGLVLTGLTILSKMAKELPNPEQFANRQIAQSTKIYDKTGEILLYEIHGEEKRAIIPFMEIPEYVKQATIAIEDQNFYNHPALDWRSMIRAFSVNLLRGRVVQGGSTITQQLAKNAFLTSEKTFSRKIKEMILSYWLERRYSKDEILNMYLNQIPYGANAYGVEAASQTYFNKPAKDLGLAEAAVLATLPKAPSYYSPWGTHVDELESRKNYVLNQMFGLKFIDEEEKTRSQNKELKFTSPNIGSIKAPHFVMMVREYLNNKYGEEEVEKGGMKITTTLDWPLQEIAERIIKEGAERNEELYKGKNASLVAQDAKTGQILALVGSRDYFDIKNDGNFNVASQGLRQPGSAFKPFAYVTAFKKGYSPETVIFDLPTEFDTSGNPLKSYQPENFDQKFRGPINFRQALAQSINIPAVKVLYLANIDDTLKTAQDFGITTLKERSRYGLSLVLGGGEVKLIEMIGAYSVFSQEGIKHQQSLILNIEDSQGKTLEKYSDQATAVIEPQPAKLINNILSDQEARKALFQNSFDLTVFSDREVALKTGTTNNYKDAWAIGYTPSLVVGVWTGNNNNQPMQKQGGSILAAVPIWHNFLNEALVSQPFESFNKPEPIFQTKPVLKGEYVVNYKLSDKNFPQIHNILYYVDKNDPLGPEPSSPEQDPQFQNWEKPILMWIKNNIPDFKQYNQPVPTDAHIEMLIEIPASTINY